MAESDDDYEEPTDMESSDVEPPVEEVGEEADTGSMWLEEDDGFDLEDSRNERRRVAYLDMTNPAARAWNIESTTHQACIRPGRRQM
jgi:hypothetical protein